MIERALAGRHRLIPAHAGKTPGTCFGTSHCRAHPRSRGENIKAKVAACCASGSSPLTRGKRARSMGPTCPVGLIPAHAGKTSSVLSISTPPRAHPRSRGENIIRSDKAEAAAGSSPLTRGKPHLHNHPFIAARLIPAHAGKTFSLKLRHKQDVAHPRSRGENIIRSDKPEAVAGSSPLTRGKHEGRASPHLPGRLIPAHAGKTPRRSGT